MKLLQALALCPLFLAPVLSQGLIARLEEVGLDGFAEMMTLYNPALVAEIAERNDVTVWAPGNAVVAARLAELTKRDNGTHSSSTSAQADHQKPPPNKKKSSKRQVGQGPPGYPDTNFQTIITFLQDPVYVNLGEGEQAKYVKNYAAPLDGGANSVSLIEVVTGLGDTQFSIRGPFKFSNGVIYEVNDFFTLPQPFTATFQQLNLAQEFYKTVVDSGKLSLFEDTPGVTIFAPLDSTNVTTTGNHTSPAPVDPKAHIVTSEQQVYYSGELMPGESIFAASGDEIKISFAENGERLVNCRRLVKGNVPCKNGVIHYIDGPLTGGCDITPGPTGPPPPFQGAGSRNTMASTGALVLAFGAALLAFY